MPVTKNGHRTRRAFSFVCRSHRQGPAKLIEYRETYQTRHADGGNFGDDLRCWLIQKQMWKGTEPNAKVAALYFLRHQSKMPPMRPPVSNAFLCFMSRLS